ncbi:DNA helicase IV [Pontiella desulfatans]|uniref:DNA 3'-5' helicase n=1 Tax=Pontiella desulfatans TaxID=2750659 RepID=A0A6C2U5G3_PONDE|nr:UvrD-helicase domain-containing protein [Pontiella desulfatans]VGO14636.1 DNA helicase IV [Pontiella desulfatans]
MPVQLTGEQRRVLTLPPNNPIQIKGVAGSGKTTVSIYRAKHLLDTERELFKASRVLVFSYTKSLVSFIKSILRDSLHNTEIEVSTFHQWAYRFLRSKGRLDGMEVLSRWQDRDSIIRVVRAKAVDRFSQLKLFQKTDQFFLDEFEWMKGKGLKVSSEYLEAQRVGRGATDRLTQHNRQVIWFMFYHYREELKRRSLIDFADFALLVADVISSSESFEAPYTHIVIDEAQDLTKMQISVIAKLVSSDTNSITIVADAAQKIYKSGFTWTEVGINVRGGRTIEFKKNYRNTREIAEAAYSVLQHDLRPDELTVAELPDRPGRLPELHLLGSTALQFSLLAEILKGIDLTKISTAILHRQRRGLAQYRDWARDYLGLEGLIIQEANDWIGDTGLYFCPMPSAKGLEFDTVILIDFNDCFFPHPPGFSDPDDEEHLNTERRLLYTSMTRAKNELYFISSDAVPSRFVSDIDPKKIITVT